ncbi:MAG: hypothetical protein QXS41_02765 [Candidatus Woesearchaeota archaeon]
MNGIFLIGIVAAIIFFMFLSLVMFKNKKLQIILYLALFGLSFLLGFSRVIELTKWYALAIVLLFYELIFFISEVRVYPLKKEFFFYVLILMFQFFTFYLFYPFLQINEVILLSVLFMLVFFDEFLIKKHTNFQIVNLLLVFLIFFYINFLVSKNLFSFFNAFFNVILSVFIAFIFSSFVTHYRKRKLILIFLINLLAVIIISKLIKLSWEISLLSFLIFSFRNKKLSKLLRSSKDYNALSNSFFFLLLGWSLGYSIVSIKNFNQLTLFLVLLTFWYFLFVLLVYVTLLSNLIKNNLINVLFYYKKYVYLLAMYLFFIGILSEKSYFFIITGFIYLFIIKTAFQHLQKLRKN